MIQIQDDTVNQVVAPAPNPTGQMYQQLIQKNQPAMSTSAPLTQSTQSIQSDVNKIENKNAAEIDRLLAELDKLSKNLEEKPVSATSSTTPVDSIQTAPLAQEPVAKEENQSAEKFDFDSFLSDLEKKIDQESDKNKTAVNNDSPMTDFPDSGKSFEDFRKNRPAMDLQDSSEAAEEPVVESVAVNDDLVAPKNDAEELKSQNIFEMLGIMNISDSEKNQFLDELETMIWDDFIFHDLELLLTSEEYVGARQILDDQVKKDDEKKEALIIYLEKLIPDLDEVLYEKALELKSEMMGERLAKMKESTDEAILSKVKEAENMISQNLWKSAASLLNQLS